jgi:hypothetical protein
MNPRSTQPPGSLAGLSRPRPPQSSLPTTRPSSSQRSIRMGIFTGWSEKKDNSVLLAIFECASVAVRKGHSCHPLAGVFDGTAGAEAVAPPTSSEIGPRVADDRRLARSAGHAGGASIVRVLPVICFGPKPQPRFSPKPPSCPWRSACWSRAFSPGPRRGAHRPPRPAARGGALRTAFMWRRDSLFHLVNAVGPFEYREVLALAVKMDESALQFVP